MEPAKEPAMEPAKLLSFTVANYRSYYTPQTFGFAGGDGQPRPLTVIYGPNSGGKSNSAYALHDFRASIANSSQASWRLPYVPFMLRDGATGEPSTFGALFSYKGCRYDYSFSFVADRVVEETLKKESLSTGRMNLVFHRGENGVDSKSASKNGFGKYLEEKTRPDTLLITKAYEDNNPFAAVVFNLVESTPVMLDQGADSAARFVEMLRGNEDLRAEILRLLKNCDFAIRDIAIDGARLSTLHAIRDVELSIVGMGAMDFWAQESNGTRKFFEMAVPIVCALSRGHTLYLDEFGTYLHPNLAKALAALFKGDENKTGACLIVNTQGTALMGDVAERDDIVLVEKDMTEESLVAPLKSRGARTTEPLESRYLRGLYGAVPRVRVR